jgi:DNA topoisomerase-1
MRPAEYSEGREGLADLKAESVNTSLRYTSDDEAGLSRRRRGSGFVYVGPNGKVVRDASELARIKSLVIPPAWNDVWISPDPQGHIAATGRDARGRKQYRYNPKFIALRDAAKFEHLVDFARCLPKLRRRIHADMARPGLPREKVLATVVHLLETTNSRIGNEDYAKNNNSFGLTTLRNRHVRVRGNEMRFVFRGKSGKMWSFAVQSRRVAHVVRACQELPGQHLFDYLDEAGEARKVDSADVNEYLREASGHDVTAKDFRTWTGTIDVALALHASACRDERPTKARVREAIERTAERLGNTVAVCRKCYVHPEIIAAFEEGALALAIPENAGRARSRFALRPEEKAVLAFLERRMRRKR